MKPTFSKSPFLSRYQLSISRARLAKRPGHVLLRQKFPGFSFEIIQEAENYQAQLRAVPNFLSHLEHPDPVTMAKASDPFYLRY